MIRYKVARKSIRWGKQTYHEGELLPESFSEKDKYRVLYPSRIEKVEMVAEEVKADKAETSEGTKSAVKTPVAPQKSTGASLSGALNKN